MTAPYSLGSFTFVNFHGMSGIGAPQTVRKTAVPLQRPGVDGTAIVTTGTKGSIFQMRSFVDVASVSAAQVLIVAYEAAVNNELLQLVHGGTNYYATPILNQYWVLDVQAGWRRSSASVGGMAGGLVGVEAFWTLLPFHVPPE